MLTNRPFRIPSISLFHLSILHSSFFLSLFLLLSWINRPALRSTLILFLSLQFSVQCGWSPSPPTSSLPPGRCRPPSLRPPIHLSCIADGLPRVDSSCLKSEQFVLSEDFHKFLVNSEKRHIIYITIHGPRHSRPNRLSAVLARVHHQFNVILQRSDASLTVANNPTARSEAISPLARWQ